MNPVQPTNAPMKARVCLGQIMTVKHSAPIGYGRSLPCPVNSLAQLANRLAPVCVGGNHVPGEACFLRFAASFLGSKLLSPSKYMHMLSEYMTGPSRLEPVITL